RLVGNYSPLTTHHSPNTKHQAPAWDNRGHFFAAAAEAMRRILVDNARRKRAIKHGGQIRRVVVNVERLENPKHDDEILAVDDALVTLGRENPRVARLVNLRYFAGMTLEETAAALHISVRTAHRYWDYARAWLHHEITRQEAGDRNQDSGFRSEETREQTG